MPRTVATSLVPEPDRPAPTRRAVIVSAALAAGVTGSGTLTGCADLAGTVRSALHDSGAPSPGTSAGADPDTVLVAQAAVALRGALAQVRRTSAAHPRLATALAPVRALHTEHLAVLRPALARSPSVTPAVTPPAGRSAGPAPVPADAHAALAALASTERALQARLTGLAVRAVSGELARLLGAMAAATSQRLSVGPT